MEAILPDSLFFSWLSTMPPPGKPVKSPLRQNTMRRSIASLAARLMAEDGIAEYGLAKRKAARQLGAPDSEVLPNNAEIEAELRIYQTLYQGEEQRQRLRQLRAAALSAMRLLADYKPYLTGSVLDGTAGRHASIELEVFCESAKEVEIFLLNQRIVFTQVEPQRGTPGAPEARLQFDLNGAPVMLSLFDTLAERVQRRGQRSSQLRARADAVALLMQGSA